MNREFFDLFTDLIHCIPMNINRFLEEMAEHGQSVILNYCDADKMWECSWITRGKQFTYSSLELRYSIRCCVMDALTTMSRDDADATYRDHRFSRPAIVEIGGQDAKEG